MIQFRFLVLLQRHPNGHHRYPAGPRSVPPSRSSGDESFGPHVSRNASRGHHAQPLPQPHGSRSGSRNVDPRRQYPASGSSRPSSDRDRSRSTSAHHAGYDVGHRGQQQNSYSAVHYKPIPDKNARILHWQAS